MKSLYLSSIGIAAMVLVISACTNSPTSSEQSSVALDQALLKQAQGLFKALPATAESATNPITPEKVALGKKLYYDTRLSKTGNNSCNSCHNLKTFGVDNKATSTGDAGKNGDRNSPTTLNAAFHATQFWDGRAKTIEEQAGMPIMNPVEMAIPSKAFLEKKLGGIDEYIKAFAAAFPGEKAPLTYDNLQNAIGAFERTLVTPTRFDAYLGGNMAALTTAEKDGMRLFISTGCTACHTGVALGGNMFQKFGLLADYHPLTGSTNADEGRKAVTKQDADRDMFKVPSLRNIAKTHPYFHDGSVASLDDAIRIMAKVQLGKDLAPAEITSISTFLNALTGEVPASAL